MSNHSFRIEHSWWELLDRQQRDQHFQPYTSSWSHDCTFCGSNLLSTETNGWCCNRGNWMLQPLPAYPESFQQLLDNNNHQLGNLPQLSRKLNHLFSFSLLGTTGSFANYSRGPLGNVVVTGRIYHRLMDLTQGEHSMKWFIYDEGSRTHIGHKQGIPQHFIDEVKSMLTAVNPYIATIRHALSTVPQDSEKLAIHLDRPVAGGEVAAIANPYNMSRISARQVVIYRGHDQAPTFVSILSPEYESLQYPLLFPHGTVGWSPKGIHNPNNLSQIMWYRYRLVSEQRFLQLSRLTNEYLVDMYSRTEDERLDYLRNSRKKQDRLIQDGDSVAMILPSSFLGSRAWSAEQVADSLALARRFGKPSFFITMTTNPFWPEIVSKLKPGQTAADVPTIVCRAFHGRLSKMVAFLKKIFGGCIYIVRVIEFQKRGLPHAHMVLKTTKEVPFQLLDTIVSAELPEETVNPRLRRTVLKFMMHPENHLANLNNRCNRKGKCTWKFPQRLRNQAELDAGGKVLYRRRKSEDAWVVSYIPALLEYMECHIHVDVSFTVDVFIYLYKYLFKGPDKANYLIDREDQVNEFQDYLNGRYLSASEAAWRIFQYNITTKEPAVLALSIHLPDQNLGQMYRVNGNESRSSSLLQYFGRPIGEPFQKILFLEYFSLYRTEALSIDRQSNHLFEDSSISKRHSTKPGYKYAVIKRKHISVTRLAIVPTRKSELFYLRALIQHIPAYSFEDFRTKENIRYNTYQEAAKAYGLFQNSDEGTLAMQEAIDSLYRPSQLRFLFSQILQDLATPPIQLWNQFKEALGSDFAIRYNSEALAERMTLASIGAILATRGLKLTQFGLPDPNTGQRSIEIELELDAFIGRQHQLKLNSHRSQDLFNPEQRFIFQKILTSALSTGFLNSANCYFINGGAGRGKTFLVNTICNELRSQGKICLITGTTALSMTLYERGRTAHSTFGIPVKENSVELTSSVPLHSGRAEMIAEASIIIWDEMPMANKAAVECAHFFLSDLLENRNPFGGKTFLGLGDFRQVAPVVLHTLAPEGVFDSSIRSSFLWGHFQILDLISPVRNASDPEYANWVDDIGEGKSNDEFGNIAVSMLPKIHSLEEAADFLFPEQLLLDDPAQCISRSYLAPLNTAVDDFNKFMLARLSGLRKTYFSHDEIHEDPDNQVQHLSGIELEYLGMMNEPGVPPHELDLREGSICSIMRNLSLEKGLVKNVRVVIRALHQHIIEVELLGNSMNPVEQDGSPGNRRFCLPRINFCFQPKMSSWSINRRQFPLRLAYATTFNSCQGLTLERVVLNLDLPVFAHGQLYTSLSRIRDRSCGRVFTEVPDNIELRVKNVVYPQLLL